MPRVSIVLPTYNGERYIRASIESILNQTYKDWELIIVNDASIDSTIDIVNEYVQRDSRIRVITNSTNKKLPESLNIGFESTSGEYLTWTSDDNMYKPKAIEFMVNHLDNHSDVDMVSCIFDFIDEDGKFVKEVDYPENRITVDLIYGCNVGACFMYRKKLADKVGKYDKDMFCAEDYDYWCRIAVSGRIDYVNNNLYKYRNNSKSLTATKKDTIAEKTRQIRLKYALNIMRRGSFSKYEQCLKLVNFYLREKEKEWLKQSMQISKLYTIRLLFKLVFKKFLFSKHKDGNNRYISILGISFRFEKRPKVVNSLKEKEWETYKRRNLEQYVYNKLFGIFGLLRKPGKVRALICKYLYRILIYKYKLFFRLFGRIYLPQLEYAVTSKCSLKCKDCINYIPSIEANFQYETTLSEFKIHLDNLLKHVEKLDTLILIGGEPLINKELPQMCEYALKLKKINRVFIISNGTIKPSVNLLNVFKKYKKKAYYILSNYSSNTALCKRLKYKEIIDIFSKHGISYIFQENYRWNKVSPIEYVDRTQKETEYYYKKCANPCVSVMNSKLSICPRITVFMLREIFVPAQDEYIDLNNEVSKSNIINFYSKSYFSGCKYCNVLNDKEIILPAIQIED